jgi:protein-tyrosine phosphatase
MTLFQSGQIDDWTEVLDRKVQLVLDMSDIDPNIPNEIQFAHVGIVDGPLPEPTILNTLHFLAQAGANEILNGRRVLSHCGAGINRSSLMNGLIIFHLGQIRGAAIVDTIRKGRPGALSNLAFADYLSALK